METKFVLTLLMWMINIVFCSSLLPQVFLNFKLKTTRGLSDFMLFFYFIGYITYNYYIFCLNLPVSYKIMGPVSLIIVLIIVAQRFVYDQSYKKDTGLLLLYVVNGLIAIVLLPYSMKNAVFFGNIAGWIQVFIWIPSGFPQILKVYAEKSVLGFSFWSVTLLFFGECTEGLITMWMGYPIQTVLNCFQGIFLYVIFCLQFWRYSPGTNNAQS